jgi:hypothetical protein
LAGLMRGLAPSAPMAPPPHPRWCLQPKTLELRSALRLWPPGSIQAGLQHLGRAGIRSSGCLGAARPQNGPLRDLRKPQMARLSRDLRDRHSPGVERGDESLIQGLEGDPRRRRQGAGPGAVDHEGQPPTRVMHITRLAALPVATQRQSERFKGGGCRLRGPGPPGSVAPTSGGVAALGTLGYPGALSWELRDTFGD